MPFDRREAILYQLYVMLGTLPSEYVFEDSMSIQLTPFGNVFRNRASLPTEKRPCIALFDGDEITIQTYSHGTRGQVMAPQIQELRPQIFVLLKEKSVDEADNYAMEISAHRMILLRALRDDVALRRLLGTSGRITKTDWFTDMKTGSSFKGQCQLNIALQYALLPEEL